MDPTQRTTPTGKVLRLLKPGEGPPDILSDALLAKEHMEAVLAAALIDSEDGKIIALTILAIPAARQGMKFYTTVTGLGDLLILRDEFDEYLAELRNPHGNNPDPDPEPNRHG